MYRFFVISFLLLYSSLYGYESEEKLQAVIIGKIAKFITWEDETNELFTITILRNQFGSIFNELYENKTIKGKKVVINYITDIEDVKHTNILYIGDVTSQELENIFTKIENKNILTISNLRGFAEKNGIVQVYFISQKPKLKINLNSAKAQNIKIKSSLLQIAEIIKGY